MDYPYINVSDGKEIIKSITDIGNKNGAKIWIQNGTLLGCIRDKGFISYDRDIDLGMEYKYWNDNIISDLKKSGFLIRFSPKLTKENIFKFVGSDKKNAGGKLRLRYKDINICFYLWHEGINEYKNFVYCNYSSKPSNLLFEMPKNLLVPQMRDMFYDLSVWIPKNNIEYLNYTYGKTWREPLINYIDSELHNQNKEKFLRNIK